MLEVAPFTVGSSVYVPLRFISESLGAVVDYDQSKGVVAISGVELAASQPSATLTPSPSPVQNSPPAPPLQPTTSPQPSASSQIHLGHEPPGDGSSIRGSRPTVQASFEGGEVDPNSVHVWLDGRDVSVSSYISTRGVTYTPQSPIIGGEHEVRIQGTDPPVDINAPHGATLGIVITSTDPDYGTAANPVRYSVRVR